MAGKRIFLNTVNNWGKPKGECVINSFRALVLDSFGSANGVRELDFGSVDWLYGRVLSAAYE